MRRRRHRRRGHVSHVRELRRHLLPDVQHLPDGLRGHVRHLRQDVRHVQDAVRTGDLPDLPDEVWPAHLSDLRDAVWDLCHLSDTVRTGDVSDVRHRLQSGHVQHLQDGLRHVPRGYVQGVYSCHMLQNL